MHCCSDLDMDTVREVAYEFEEAMNMVKSEY